LKFEIGKHVSSRLFECDHIDLRGPTCAQTCGGGHISLLP